MTDKPVTIDDLRLRAGWYEDQRDPTAERWWNGSQWTSHTRPGQTPWAAGDPQGAAPFAWSAADDPPDTAGAFGRDVVPADPGAVTDPPPVTLAPAPPAIPAGWYPDPAGLPAQRWWHGTGWSEHTAPAAPAGTTVVLVGPQKSVAVALVLTFFFGPLGMFYSTVSGALIMLGVLFVGGFVAGVVTLGLAWLVWGPMVWLVSMVWGGLAAADRPRARIVTAYR